MIKLDPYKFKIPLDPINPKDAVPDAILEQHPWHWDPMQSDHNDAGCYRGKVDFDWEGLARFAINKANDHMTPEKFWWYDYDNERIMHANDDVSDAPIREQALLALKNNTHTAYNTQYFKIANEDFEHWFAKIPKGKLVCLQSNDYVAIDEHVNCVKDSLHFAEMAPLSKVLFTGELPLEKYTRFMRIGYV